MAIVRSFSKQQLIMTLLAGFSVFLLAFEVTIGLKLGQFPWMNLVDIAISLIFLLDYFWHRHLSPNKHVFFRRHWIDLLAAIPLVGSVGSFLISTHLFYGFTLMHILRLARLALRIKILLHASQDYTHKSYLIYVSTTVTFIIISGAAGFYWFENGHNPNIHSFGDAVWWAIVTTTTIGYGDIYPVTFPGRIIAVVVMFVGIATLGTLIALIESVMLGKKSR